MDDFWRRVELGRPAGYWEDLFCTLRAQALSSLDARLEADLVTWQGFGLPAEQTGETTGGDSNGRPCRVALHLLENLEESERTTWLAELDSEAICRELFVLLRVRPDRAPLPMVSRLIDEALGPPLDGTALLRQIHLTTTFRLDLRETFERRRLRLDLLHFARDEEASP